MGDTERAQQGLCASLRVKEKTARRRDRGTGGRMKHGLQKKERVRILVGEVE